MLIGAGSARGRTLCDSTPGGICWSVFLVRSITDRPGTFHNSVSDSGYSVDNLAPNVPAGLVVHTVPGGTELTWQIGRPVTQTPFEIRRGFQERARYMSDVAAEALSDVVLEPKDGFRRFIRRERL